MICFSRQLLVGLGVDAATVDAVAPGDGVAVSATFAFGDRGGPGHEVRVLEAEPEPRHVVLVGMGDRHGEAGRRAARVEELCVEKDSHRVPTRDEARRVTEVLTEVLDARRHHPAAGILRTVFARIAAGCESPYACQRTGNCQRWMREQVGCATAATDAASPARLAPSSASPAAETGPGAPVATTSRVFLPHAQSFRIYGGVLHVDGKDQPRTGHAWYVPGEPGFSSYDGDPLTALDNVARQLRAVASDVEAVRAQLTRGSAPR